MSFTSAHPLPPLRYRQERSSSKEGRLEMSSCKQALMSAIASPNFPPPSLSMPSPIFNRSCSVSYIGAKSVKSSQVSFHESSGGLEVGSGEEDWVVGVGGGNKTGGVTFTRLGVEGRDRPHRPSKAASALDPCARPAAASDAEEKGHSPTTSTYETIPNAQTSCGGPIYTSPRRISGPA